MLRRPQDPAEVRRTLEALVTELRTNDAGTMTSVTSSLTDDDIVNIAHYLVGL